MKKCALIIDCDPGLDDAINLMLTLGASEQLNLLGITTVAGNVDLAQTQRNARLVCQLAGYPQVPVYAGCAKPILRDLVKAEAFHGATGLLGVDLFEPKTPLQPQHAVDFIVNTLMAATDEQITLVPTGPLTNIAMAVIKEPRILPKIEKIVLMGGSASEGGNVTPAAEFNIYVDPQAADVVFRCGRPLVVMGLDVTHQARITRERVAHVAALQTPVASIAKTILESIQQPYQKKYGEDAAPLHDPCTVAYLLQPELFSGVVANVSVETHSELTMGATIVDDRQRTDRPQNAIWIKRINPDGFFELITEHIARLPVQKHSSE